MVSLKASALDRRKLLLFFSLGKRIRLKSPMRSLGDCGGGSICLSSSRNSSFRSLCEGAYTLVIKMLCCEARHETVRVEVKPLWSQLRSEKQRELVAERIPPAEPIVSRWLFESRNRGKIERSLMVSGLCNLVS